MSNNRIFAVIGSAVLLIGLVTYLFYFYGDQLNFEKYFSFNKFKPKITIEDPIYNRSYTVNLELLNDPEIVEIIKGTDVDRYRIVATIVDDVELIGFHYLIEGQTASGYTFEIDHESQLVRIPIYISRDLSPELALNFLNRNFNSGLMSAAEKNKEEKDPSYKPNYEAARSASHKIFLKASDQGYYYIVYDTND